MSTFSFSSARDKRTALDTSAIGLGLLVAAKDRGEGDSMGAKEASGVRLLTCETWCEIVLAAPGSADRVSATGDPPFPLLVGTSAVSFGLSAGGPGEIPGAGSFNSAGLGVISSLSCCHENRLPLLVFSGREVFTGLSGAGCDDDRSWGSEVDAFASVLEWFSVI